MRKPKTDTGEQSNSPLLCRLRERLRERRRLPFSEFMHAALYDPEHGYYTSGSSPWGAGGDYVTAPQVHPALGRAIAQLTLELDLELEQPDPFVLIEAGSGDGRLMSVVAATLRHQNPDLWRRLRIFCVDPGDSERGLREAACPVPARGVNVVPDLGDVPDSGSGLLYSNELFDAFAVERVRCRRGRLQRSYVEAHDGVLRECFHDDELAAVRQYLRDNHIRLRDGQIAEVCLRVAPWLQQASRCLTAGAWLTIDYGHETENLFGPGRPLGTLVAHRRFAIGDDLLARPGEQDLTSHVDFGNLRRVGRALGWEDRELCSLRVFLLGMGAATAVGAGAHERLALRHLLVSEIGDAHRVLLQVRGLAPGRPRFGRERLQVC